MRSLAQTVSDVAQSTKGTASVSGVTITLGGATWMQMIPSVIGVLTSIAGLVLSIVLIINIFKKWKVDKVERKARRAREEEKHDIEMQILRKKAGL